MDLQNKKMALLELPLSCMYVKQLHLNNGKEFTSCSKVGKLYFLQERECHLAIFVMIYRKEKKWPYWNCLSHIH